jgi:hypothetical protein
MRLPGSWRLRGARKQRQDSLCAGSFAEAVPQGQAYSIFGGQGAEDGVDSGFVEGTHASEETASENFFVVPGSPGVGVGSARGVPAIGEHEAKVVGREIQ